MVDEQSEDPTPEQPADEWIGGGYNSNCDRVEVDEALAQLRIDMSIADLRRQRTAVERSRVETSTENLLVRSIDQVTTIWPNSGGTVSGRVVEVGRDYVCLEPPTGPIWVALYAVTAVRTPVDPGTAPATTSTVGAGLRDVVEDLMSGESEILVLLRSGETIAGMPAAVGEAIVMRSSAGFVLIPLHSVEMISRGPRPHDR